TIERLRELGRGVVAHGPVGAYVVRHATGQEGLGKPDGAPYRLIYLLVNDPILGLDENPPHPRRLTRIEHDEGRQAGERSQVAAGEDFVAVTEYPATRAVDRVEVGMAGIVHDVVVACPEALQQLAPARLRPAEWPYARARQSFFKELLDSLAFPDCARQVLSR